MTINQHLDTLAAVGLELESFGQRIVLFCVPIQPGLKGKKKTRPKK